MRSGDLLYRYRHADDFGHPETAFAVCGFWYVNALAAIGDVEQARAVLAPAGALQSLGLLSEDIHPKPASCGETFRRPTAWWASSTAHCA
jgi:GH15 family glucan-1,4-alpha-glucosidase